MYCVWWSEEDSRKLTGQLVVLAVETLELGQIANALWKLCRHELFSREILRPAPTFQPVPNQLTSQLVLVAVELFQIRKIADARRKL